jgi:hypothetical protein
MQRDEVRKVVTAQFYQSLAESSVPIKSIPQAELQALVNALADGMTAALSAVEDVAARSLPTGSRAVQLQGGSQPGAAVEETLLWTGKPYLSIGMRYELTSQRLRIIHGLIGRDLEEIELVQVRDIDASQNIGDRVLNIGDVKVLSNDPSRGEIILSNVSNPLEVREILRKAVMAEKQRLGFRYQEEM